MSRESDRVRLERIVAYIKDVEAIASHHNGISRTLADTEGQYAILLCLTQIGELLGKITTPELTRHLPVRLAVGLRNIIVHDYEGVDMRVIEATVTEQLPALSARISELLGLDRLVTRSGLRAHALQHVRFEGLGSIEPWLVDAGYEVTRTRFFESDGLPAPDEVDFVIALGGPMSVNDEAEFPWLREEKRFIRRAIESGTAVLGICLGAQLIASAMGARVYANPTREIGWFPVHGVRAPAGAAVSDGVYRFPDTFDAFHWHGETFDLPPGATLIARNQTCANQAFAMGASTLGMQFHLEATPASVQDLVANCRDELIEAPFVQTEAEILAAPAERYRQINSLMDGVLRRLTAAPRTTARKK